MDKDGDAVAGAELLAQNAIDYSVERQIEVVRLGQDLFGDPSKPHSEVLWKLALDGVVTLHPRIGRVTGEIDRPVVIEDHLRPRVSGGEHDDERTYRDKTRSEIHETLLCGTQE